MNAAQGTAEQARDSQWMDRGIRVGLVAYGLVHLVVAFLAVKLALGDREGQVSSTGALAEIAQQPFGRTLLWIIGIGLFILVLWRLSETVLGDGSETDGPEWGSRIGAGLKAAVYATLGFSALQVATSDDSSSKGQGGGGSSITGTVMGWPGGQWLIALAGLAVMGYGAFQAWTGFSDKHRDKLEAEGKSGEDGKAFLLFGKIGYVAKGAALLLVGGIIAWAGIQHDSKDSNTGLDQALSSLLDEPFGPWIVGVIGVGLGCYGLFCFARALHLNR